MKDHGNLSNRNTSLRYSVVRVDGHGNQYSNKAFMLTLEELSAYNCSDGGECQYIFRKVISGDKLVL